MLDSTTPGKVSKKSSVSDSCKVRSVRLRPSLCFLRLASSENNGNDVFNPFYVA